jgi:adenylate cyclase class 2
LASGMIEFEVKAKATEEALRRIEGTFHKRYEVLQVDIYFRHPCRDFAATDEALRVRFEDPDMGGTGMTYKGPKIDSVSKTREEVEVRLKRDDVEKVSKILERLGFEKLAVVRKLRRAYDAGEITLFVDSVEGLGNFVEAESNVSYVADVPSVVSGLVSFLRGLGLDSLERRSYLELLLSRQER